MIKATFAGPLRYAANKIDFAAIYFPAPITNLDDRAHWPSTDDAPLAFSDIGNSHRFAVYQSGDGPNTDRISDPIDVAAQR